MEFIDYYKVLELNKSATEADIKKAYRRMARKYHPDLNPNDAGAKKKFQQINEANEVLSDSEKRKKYDTYGKDWQQGEDFEKAKQSAHYSRKQQGFQSDESDFSDFFESMFGGAAGRGSSAKFKGQDIRAELQLDLKEAFKTHPQTFTVNGKAIRINIPAGIENGQTIRIQGHGGVGMNGGPAGDLYITFLITNSTLFKRKGNDLYLTHFIDLEKALLGGEDLVPTMDGKVKLIIKPETANGTVVKLKGKGFPVYKQEGVFGDLYLTFQVKIPSGLNETQKNLFREIFKTLRHEN